MRLWECFNACFVAVLEILQAKPGRAEPPGEAARRECLASLDHAVETASAFYETRTLFLARRLVTAWVDERLASEPWPGQGGWLARPLHSEWNEGRSSGEWFFATAGALTPGRQDHDELARLALRCMSLGMEGPYFDRREEMLQVRRDLAFRFGIAATTAPFPPLAEALATAAAKTRRGLWWLPVLLAVALALAYLAGGSALNRRLEAVLAEGADPALSHYRGDTP